MKVFTKKQFIDYLQKELPEDEAIILSNVVHGKVEYLKSLKGIRVSVMFGEGVFSRFNGDMMEGKVKPLSFAVCKQEALKQPVADAIKSILKDGQ